MSWVKVDFGDIKNKDVIRHVVNETDYSSPAVVIEDNHILNGNKYILVEDMFDEKQLVWEQNSIFEYQRWE